MGGRGSGGACRNQGRRKLARYLPSHVLQRLFGRKKRVAKGPSKGAAYTRSTLTNLAPVATAYFLKLLAAAGHEQAAAGAAFCSMMLLYLVARFGKGRASSWDSGSGADIRGEGAASPLVAECLQAVQCELPWHFPGEAPVGAHPVVRGLAGARATPARVADALLLHGFATAADPLTAKAAALREQMIVQGVDLDAQLRTMFLVGRLRDAGVVNWMLEAGWACLDSVALATFIQQAPSDKAPGSLEITLMGKNSRNAAAAVPLWDELFERADCWTKTVQNAPSYREAVEITQKKFAGVSGFVGKNVINVIYDVDNVLDRPRLLKAQDRASAPPVVGPGPRASISWLSGGSVHTLGACSDFIHSVVPVLGQTLDMIWSGSGRLWQGEFSSNQVQLHACSAHRWLMRLRLRIGPAWRDCRQARRPAFRVRGKRTL